MEEEESVGIVFPLDREKPGVVFAPERLLPMRLEVPGETLATALGRRQERRRGDARQLEPLGDRGAEWFHQTRSDDEISAPCALSVRSTWCVGLDERWRWTLKTL